jgi:hypothetical protein
MNHILRTNRKICTLNWTMLILVYLLCRATANGQPHTDHTKVTTHRMITTSITFRGVANGGELILAEALNRNMRIATIQTQAGETAEVVANRLAEYINRNNPFEWHIPARYEGKPIKSEGGTLKGLPGGRTKYILAGTETGLGIPLPPCSLSCTLFAKDKRLLLSWENPLGAYDEIAIVYNWTNFDHRGGDRVEGDSSSFIVDLNQRTLDTSDLDVWVIGLRNGLPSNAGAIRLDGNSQEELFGIPFTSRVAPNWKAWSLDTAPNIEQFSCSIKDNLTAVREMGKRYNSIKTNDSKPFRQVLKSPAQGGTLGIWRKFLGLSPGHTYKLSARLSTLDMSGNDTEWEFSMHAMPDKPDKKELTANQMSGLEVLPNGETGPQAGRITEFGPGKLTAKNEYVIHSADITLPEDSNSITVWLRHTGKGTSGVGFDWIKLEDLSMTGNESEK